MYPPLFTVVIPALKARDTVASAIESVLAQTEARFELIVVDDGSPDDTADVVADYLSDPRVRLVRQQNAGPAVARNRGIAAGAAPFVAFLDADDRWTEDHLAVHARHLNDKPHVGISFGRVRFFDPAMRAGGRRAGFVAELSLAHAIGENPICTTSNLVARRSAFERVGGFDPTMRHAEDQEWVARVLAATRWAACGVDATTVDYRLSANGLSADLDEMLAGWSAMLERIRALQPLTVAEAEPAARALFERYLARRALRTGQSGALALRHLATAVSQDWVALLVFGAKRSLLTLCGAIAATFLPNALIRLVVAR